MMQLFPMVERLGLNRMFQICERIFVSFPHKYPIKQQLHPMLTQLRFYNDNYPRRREYNNKFSDSRNKYKGETGNNRRNDGLFEPDDDIENVENLRKFNDRNPRYSQDEDSDEPRSFGKRIRSYNPNIQQTANSPNYIELGERKTTKLSDLQEEVPEYRQRLIDNVLTLAAKTRKSLSRENWESLKAEAVQKFRLASEASFGGVMLGSCITYKNSPLGKSLMGFLRGEDEQIPISPVVMAKYLRLCYECFESVGETELLRVYEEVRKMCQEFDSASAENIALALCRTSKWRDAEEFIQMAYITGSPSGFAVSEFVKTAFSHQELELGWKYVEKMAVENKTVHEFVYESWLTECKRIDGETRRVMVEKLLGFFREHEIYPQRSTIELIKFLFESMTDEHWKGNYASISLDKCKCPACQAQLESIQLSEEQFEALRTGFLGNVIEGTDIFRKTTPDELERFKSLVSLTAPYDIVIDGLNVAMLQSRGTRVQHLDQLVSVVRQLALKKNKILVLGRKHMLNWPKKGMEFIQYRADCFFAENLSKDDPFMLYAAMVSGLGTVFVSRDLMRNHCYSLKDPELRKYFKQWQRKHQLLLIGVEEDGTLHYRPPLEVNPVTQRIGESWHIPYDNGADMCRTTIEAPKSWLCLVKSQDAAKSPVK